MKHRNEPPARAGGAVTPTDHTLDKPHRFGLGYQNVELVADDNSVHIHPVEDVIWSTFAQSWPSEGHRVSFIDGDPSNVAFENLKLLTPEEAAQVDRRNEDICLRAASQADWRVQSLESGDYLVSSIDGTAFQCLGIAGLMAFVQKELNVPRWPWH